ncbi:MAG TPA: HK97 family phage prohead protease [Amaricoccus sp.]|uniref:HK97 family phage prohead protease n=1 Tax=Amaricoccus sp. TaxID=1872485 RepID=UPI002CE52854|nr:HK97 family phage prohead protease [Amaricoccus sp.]HMQ95137.1 HK97 family phage prohead protease [Amaricoccus sp.]HMR51494.1 HK97 family phage prohead protease [Amaricoccus sp.]HMR60663.1 HK97 family phage prohead protease [Amaricoccus sp.]HMT98470.1 HK97 family phage prohead protease [Amaricoccus sp.]
MIHQTSGFSPLETKFRGFDGELALKDETEIAGYASIFGAADHGGDVVQPGAYGASLAALAKAGRGVKMLWQHDPSRPIGVWDEVREDKRGLFVRGRLLPEVQAGREALVLLKAGAIDGLSIGYRTLRSEKAAGGKRLLHEIELWEVSLVTFPMLSDARVQAEISEEEADLARTLTDAFREARELLA